MKRSTGAARMSRRATLAWTAAGLSLPLTGAARNVTRSTFDPLDPQQNLSLYVKLQYSLVKEPVHSYFGGLMFAQEGDLPLRLLLAYDGYGQGWVEPQPDGSYKLAWKEIGLMKDPEHRDHRRQHLHQGRGLSPGLLPEEPAPVLLLPLRLRRATPASRTLWGKPETQ